MLSKILQADRKWYQMETWLYTKGSQALEPFFLTQILLKDNWLNKTRTMYCRVHNKCKSKMQDNNSIKQALANKGPWAKSSPSSVSVNDSLLGHRQTHSFMYCSWLLSHSNSRVEQLWQRLHDPQNLKYLLGPLTKSLLAPEIKSLGNTLL